MRTNITGNSLRFSWNSCEDKYFLRPSHISILQYYNYNTNIAAVQNYKSSVAATECRIMKFYIAINILLDMLYDILWKIKICNMAIARNSLVWRQLHDESILYVVIYHKDKQAYQQDEWYSI
jgi:hypothetical protein